MKKIALMLAACLLSGPALAGGSFAPPAKYDGPSKIKTYIIAAPVSQLQKHCKPWRTSALQVFFGCSFIYDNPRRCVVFIPDKSFPNWAWPEGGTLIVRPGDVLRHERGHCNGWPSNHPRK